MGRTWAVWRRRTRCVFSSFLPPLPPDCLSANPDLGEADLKLVKRLGGTFRIVATSRDAPKIVRVLEFLLFAVISLSLEDSLLVDLGCPRPQLDTDIDTESQEVFEPFPLVQPDPLDDTGEDVERVSSLSNWQKVALDKYPTVDFRPRRLRTSFSAFGAEGWSSKLPLSRTTPPQLIMLTRFLSSNRTHRTTSSSRSEVPQTRQTHRLQVFIHVRRPLLRPCFACHLGSSISLRRPLASVS